MEYQLTVRVRKYLCARQVHEDVLADRNSVLSRRFGPDRLPGDLDLEDALRAVVADAPQPAGEGVGAGLRDYLDVFGPYADLDLGRAPGMSQAPDSGRPPSAKGPSLRSTVRKFIAGEPMK